jgi:demethoxyubiquinone hydroxylase (CLK1/Coq7/Cat5 family)
MADSLEDTLEERVVWPSWLFTEMKTNHIGELAAVFMYIGAQRALILKFKLLSFCPYFIKYKEPIKKAMNFVRRQVETETVHFKIMSSLLPQTHQTRFCFFWRINAFLLGFLPTFIAGPRALYWTVYAVEKFV